MGHRYLPRRHHRQRYAALISTWCVRQRDQPHAPWSNGRTVIFGLAGSHRQRHATFTPVAVTGYNQDVVVEADAPETCRQPIPPAVTGDPHQRQYVLQCHHGRRVSPRWAAPCTRRAIMPPIPTAASRAGFNHHQHACTLPFITRMPPALPAIAPISYRWQSAMRRLNSRPQRPRAASRFSVRRRQRRRQCPG